MILDGKKVSNEIIDELKEKINALNKKINFAIIWVGNDASSNIYVKNKIKKCESVGINAILYHLDENTSEPLYHAKNNSDSSPDFKNKTGCGWLNVTNTVKVKEYILNMSKIMSKINRQCKKYKKY